MMGVGFRAEETGGWCCWVDRCRLVAMMEKCGILGVLGVLNDMLREPMAHSEGEG